MPSPSTSPPTVSVIMPAYRAGGTIGRAIDSILAQTYPVHEILVVDDGSPEDLAAILAPYGERVSLVRQPNGGAAAARNRGLDLARGDLVAFLDADDQWLPEKVEQCVTVFQQQPDVGLVASRYSLQDADGGPVRTAGPEPGWCHRRTHVRASQVLDFARNIVTTTVVVRRQLLQDQRFDVTLATAEDRDLWIRLLLATEVYFIDAPLCIYLVSPTSLSHGNVDLDCTCMLRVIDRYASRLGIGISRRERSYVHYKWAAGLGDGRAALSHWAQATWLWPLPYARQRTRCWLARPRLLVSILRRLLRPADLARGLQ